MNEPSDRLGQPSQARPAVPGSPVPPQAPPLTAAPRAMTWPVITVLGVMAGILAALGEVWAGLPLALAAALVWRGRQGWQLALIVVGLGSGFLSARQVLHQSDTLAPWIGARVTLQGEWDGQFLRLSDPPARVALSPRPTHGAGALTVSGVLVRPTAARTPGGFDQARWLAAQGGWGLPTPRTVLVAAQVRDSRPHQGLRAHLLRGLSVGLSPTQSALLKAIELGDRQALRELTDQGGPDLQTAFARSGLTHLMALSGQNVALITACVLWLISRLGIPPAWRYGGAAAVLVVFLGVVGISPSILRATLMGLAVLGGLALGRGRPDPLGTLALAGLACLLPFPLWLLDLGFQLSFVAVLGLTLTPQLALRLPARWPHGLRLALAATILAELATLPLIAGTFGQVPLVGLPANLLAGVIMTVLVPLGLLAALLGPLAGVVNWLTGPLLSALTGLAQTFAQAPVLPWGAVTAAGYAAYAIAALAVAWWLRSRLRGHIALGVVLAAALLSWLPATLRPPREIVYLDVGQGDATLIRDGSFSALIDGGGTPRGDYDVGARTVIPALRALGVHDLDIVVATHTDADHIEGLLAVVRQLPVGELWIGQRQSEAPLLGELLHVAAERGVPVREVRRGDTVQAGRLKLTVLWPRGAPWSVEDNENSVALRLEQSNWRALFVGDLPSTVEGYLGAGPADLLKVAHHGSRWSTGQPFLQELRPKDAVISVGRNTFGHPNAEVLGRLAGAGVTVWRTDQVGTVRWPLPP